MKLMSFEKALSEAQQNIELNYDIEINRIKEAIDAQFDLIEFYISSIVYDPYTDCDSYTNILFSFIYKNYVTLYSTFDLTTRGFYGSARMLFRNIYENLVISKTIAITKDEVLRLRWENGSQISLKSQIFNKVISPSSEAMKEFWADLCKFTHATIDSQQMLFDYQNLKNEVAVNYAIIKLLIIMNYHVLNSYAANRSIQYYTAYAIDIAEGSNAFNEKKQNIRKQVDSLRKSLVNLPRQAAIDFTRKKWLFASKVAMKSI